MNSYLNTKKTIDIRLIWDTLKIEIREITSVYCRNKAKSTRENLRNLEKDLEFKIKLKDGLQYNDENLDKDINDLEHKISKIYENKAKGAQVRSREKWVELGEKNNSYFLGLEKNSGTNGLKQALAFRLYSSLNEDEIIKEDENTVLYKVKTCRVQSARRRKNLDDCCRLGCQE